MERAPDRAAIDAFARLLEANLDLQYAEYWDGDESGQDWLSAFFTAGSGSGGAAGALRA